MNVISSNIWKASLSAAVCAYLLAASVAPGADAPTPGDAQNGKQVFERVGCSRCHGSAGEGMSPTGQEGGPPKIAGTHLALRDFVDSVRHPKGAMPPFGSQQVSDQDLGNVYAYLHSTDLVAKISLPTSANAKHGQQLYTSFGCYQCHGYEGQGSGQTGGARIGPPQTPYSGFVAYVRQPSGQMPPYTAKAASDAQLADIYAFLQSRALPPPSKTIPLLNQ
jgi:mono/diheme cytochrome c family protein